MYLDREPVIGINKFDQDRELILMVHESLFSYQVIHINFQQLVQLIPFEEPVADFSLGARYARKHPGFTRIQVRSKIYP